MIVRYYFHLQHVYKNKQILFKKIIRNLVQATFHLEVERELL